MVHDSYFAAGTFHTNTSAVGTALTNPAVGMCSMTMLDGAAVAGGFGTLERPG